MTAAATHARPRPDAGFSVVLAVASILVLLILGLSIATIVIEDSDLAVNHVRSNQALYAAHAGVEYAVLKLASNGAWGGLPAPGKTVGAGSFWIAAPDSLDETGAPLPSGQKRIVATGVVGDAKREVQVHVSSGAIVTVAGSGSAGYTGDGGAATAAQIKNPEGIDIAGSGDVYLTDSDNNVIRKVDAITGIITTVAGNGSPGYTGDGGPATSARLKFPEDVYLASNGDLYIADTGNHVIRKVVAATGVITTIAGNGSPGATGDGGAATAARLNSPRGIAVASNGDLYIGDRSNNKIRKVTAATGIITTFAGTGTAGYSGDGGAATAAKLKLPQGIHLTAAGDLYVADAGNNAVRKISPAGIITTFAGTGTAGYTGDGGAATAARLTAAESVHRASSGDILIADTGNSVIRSVSAATGRISTVAGTGVAGFSGDGGAATSARLDTPRGVDVGAGGVFYISDRNNQRIRKVTGSLAVVAWVETRR
ncbi:MAG TPA: hypothetical protein VF363_07195 [Candidatus Eisenbacteria bacterium]